MSTVILKFFLYGETVPARVHLKGDDDENVKFFMDNNIDLTIRELSDGDMIIYADDQPLFTFGDEENIEDTLTAVRECLQDEMQDEPAEYDMRIHHNPSAYAWAKFYKETFPDADEELMVGWFANAMMAMHDHVMREYVHPLHQHNEELQDRLCDYVRRYD